MAPVCGTGKTDRIPAERNDLGPEILALANCAHFSLLTYLHQSAHIVLRLSWNNKRRY